MIAYQNLRKNTDSWKKEIYEPADVVQEQ